jgi:hypothetical protein
MVIEEDSLMKIGGDFETLIYLAYPTDVGLRFKFET